MTDVRSETDPKYFLQADPTAAVLGILLGTRQRVVVEEQVIDFFVHELAPDNIDTFAIISGIGRIISGLFLSGIITRLPGTPSDVLLTPKSNRRLWRQELVWSGHIPGHSIIFEQLINGFDQWSEQWAATHPAQIPHLPIAC